MRILICGDWHANTGHGLFMTKLAQRYECGAILQCGDFGYWPRQHDKFLYKLSTRTKVPIYWIDGNHEDFHALQSATGARLPNDDGMYELQPNLYYIPRGTLWKWDNTTFLACGGAFSIDRHHRTLGRDYFNEEMISQRDFDKCTGHGNVDVMVTHDSPASAVLHDNFKNDPSTASNRHAVDALMDLYGPMFLFHGHYHFYYQQVVDDTVIVGLNKDEAPHSFVVFDTVTKEVIKQ